MAVAFHTRLFTCSVRSILKAWRGTVCLASSAMFYVTSRYNALQRVTTRYDALRRVTTRYDALRRVTTRYNALQRGLPLLFWVSSRVTLHCYRSTEICCGCWRKGQQVNLIVMLYIELKLFYYGVWSLVVASVLRWMVAES